MSRIFSSYIAWKYHLQSRDFITENGWTGSSTKKWFVVFWYCLLQAFVTLTTTSYVSAEFLVQETYGGTTQVVALGQSMFIIGTAVGPAFLGPLSYVPHPNPAASYLLHC